MGEKQQRKVFHFKLISLESQKTQNNSNLNKINFFSLSGNRCLHLVSVELVCSMPETHILYLFANVTLGKRPLPHGPKWLHEL